MCGGGSGGTTVRVSEEEALLLLYLQLYFVVAVAFLDHSFLVSSIAILSFILNFQLVLR